MVAWRSPEVEKLWKILRETKWDCKDKELEKDIFFGDEEVEHKFSIKKYQYANLNGAEGWLHLWKPIGHEIDELVKREGE